MSKDIEELTALNRDYVNSVQNCDVKRFDEILAQDFYCSNPDKSLVDRAAFLKQTAVPVTIKNLTAHDVKIRVLGDFAIIHAATSYTTADGQQAHGRPRLFHDEGVHAQQAHGDAGYEASAPRVCEASDPCELKWSWTRTRSRNSLVW